MSLSGEPDRNITFLFPVFQLQPGEVNGLALRPVTNQEHSRSTNGHLPEVGHMELEKLVIKVTVGLHTN